MDIGETFRHMNLYGMREVEVPWPTMLKIVAHLQVECPSILEAWGACNALDMYGQRWFGVRLNRPRD